MGRGYFSSHEIEVLKRNRYVNDVDDKRILYSNDFKKHFIQEYMKGKRPSQIFKESGFNVQILGDKRIERACSRWRQVYEAGGLDAFDGEKTRDLRKTKTTELEEQVETLTAKLKRTEEAYGEKRQKINDLQNELDNLRLMVVRLNKRNTELENQIEKLSTYSNSREAVQAL